MIKPRMKVATMFALVVTDAAASPAVLRDALDNSLQRSFNTITVDGDTSTNDTLFALASGRSGVKLAPAAPGFGQFCGAFRAVCLELAAMIAAAGAPNKCWAFK
jgi:glutamate N-acetyltransferase/amino-acid N-acetyltransferase